MTERRQNQFPWDIGVAPTGSTGLAGEPDGLLFSEEFREGRGNYDPEAEYVKPTGRSATSMPGFQYFDTTVWDVWQPTEPQPPGSCCAIDTNRGAGVVLPFSNPPAGETWAWSGITRRIPLPPLFQGDDEYFLDLFCRSGLLSLTALTDQPFAGFGGVILSLMDLSGFEDGSFIHVGWGASDPDNPVFRPLISKWSDASTLVDTVEVQRGTFESTLRLMLEVETGGGPVPDASELSVAYAFDGDTRGEGWRCFSQGQLLLESEFPSPLLTIGIAATGFNSDVVLNAIGSWTDFIRLYGPLPGPDFDTGRSFFRTTGGRNWPGGA
jgi:hypothetical protein